MTITESYPIHRCVYRNDAVKLRELLMDSKFKDRINESDNHGNSPLHLALMLNRYSCISLLIKNGGDIFTRNNYGWSPMDEATMLGNPDIIEQLCYLRWKEVMNKITEKGGLLDQWNQTTPNLLLRFKEKVRTTVPLLQKLGYKDILTFYKKGNSVRLDFSIAGFDLRGIPKVIRGKMSFLLRFDESSGIYKIYIIDHNEKAYQEFYPSLPKWYLDNNVRTKLAATKVFKILFDLSQFTIKEKKGGLIKKGTKTFQLEDGKSYKCVQYKGKKANFIIRKRNDEAKIGESESVIKTKQVKGDSNSNSQFAQIIKNDKSGKSSDSIKRKNTESSNSDDESDSDMSDSDNDSNYSDDEETSSNKLPRQDSKNSNISEKINSLNSKKNESNGDNTVTYTVNEDGTSKTYEKATELEDTLDWEQAYCDKYYQQSNDVVHSLFDSKEDGETKHLNHMDIVKLNLKKITEEEYFDSKSTDPMHMGRIMNVVEEKKIYKHKVKFWMTKESSNFPIVPYDIKPIFEFMMMLALDQIKSKDSANNLDKTTYDFVTKDLIERAQKKKMFPVKISIPIYPSIAFQLTFLKCSKDIKSLPDELFQIPNDYKNTDVYFKVINK